MTAANTTAPAKFEITKGCPGLGIAKGSKGTATLTHVPDFGIRVSMDFNNGRRSVVFLSGNRVNIPSTEAGRSYNAHKGDPTRSIKITFI
jgi:hypothetical protein